MSLLFQVFHLTESKTPYSANFDNLKNVYSLYDHLIQFQIMKRYSNNCIIVSCCNWFPKENLLETISIDTLFE